MELPVVLQATQFALSVALGAALGVLYDLFRALRRLYPRLTILLDCIYVILLLPVLLLFALYVGRGLLRLFMLAGSILGGLIYLLTVSRGAQFLFVRFFRLLFVPFSLLRRGIRRFFLFLRKICKKIVAIVKKNSNIDNKRFLRKQRRKASGKTRHRQRGEVRIENTH